MEAWFQITWTQLVAMTLSAVMIYIALMVLVKINGLRSFSKMSSHDFAVTIAIGTVVASVILQKSVSVLQGILGAGLLLGLQSLFSYWRIKRRGFYLENKPILLVRNGLLLEGKLEQAKITKDDIFARLREANVLSLDHVQAVVLESTGNITVLHGKGRLQHEMLYGVSDP